MSEISVIVRRAPRLLGEIITAALAREEDVRVVGEVESEHELFDLCYRHQPNLVFMGAVDTDIGKLGRRLLQRSPGTKVVALAENGRSSVLFELRPHKIEIGEVSAKELVQVVARLLREDEESTW